MGIDRYFEAREKQMREQRKEYAPEWLLLKELNELYKDGGTIAEWAVLFDKVEKELKDERR